MKVFYYFDYKSPYAYLAQEDTLKLENEFAIELILIPYTLHIPDFLGRAELDGNGNLLVNERNVHQWRRVHYAYMDCRREANRRGLTLRGPRKIFDSSIAHIGFLYAQQHGDARRYHRSVFELFWKRELDIEDPAAISRQLDNCGIDAGAFAGFLAGPGRAAHDRLRAQAEAEGVFGVPSYLVDGELYWGGERIDRVRERLAG
jgi:2-hydroxychromene-2-carboxylate isomerase